MDSRWHKTSLINIVQTHYNKCTTATTGSVANKHITRDTSAFEKC